ncbi:MAG: OmpA family protein [Pseudomonadota bacterium]
MKTVSTMMLAGAAIALAACGATEDTSDSGTAAATGASENTVYFGYDRSDLTTLGQATVDEASSVATANSAGVSLVGHTDTTGSVEYNQALSERRAETVQSAMIANGVDAASITASGRSELDPAVDTGDGVREPRNRRVEISLSGVAAEAIDPAPVGAGNCILRSSPDPEIDGTCVQETDGSTIGEG